MFTVENLTQWRVFTSQKRITERFVGGDKNKTPVAVVQNAQVPFQG